MWGGRCCWVGGCTKHVAKEDRAIASECAEPKVHSSTSPAHPRALRASQRVVLAPSTPCSQQQQGAEKGVVSPVWGRSGRSRGWGSAERRALVQLAHGAAKYARASRAYAPTIRPKQGSATHHELKRLPVAGPGACACACSRVFSHMLYTLFKFLACFNFDVYMIIKWF